MPRSLKRAPACVPGRDVHVFLTVERRNLDVAAKRERRKGDRHLAIEIVFLAMEERVLLDVDNDVEIAGRAPGAAMFAFAIEAQPLARRDAGGNLDGQLALARRASRSAAGVARPGDRLSGPAAVRARPRNRKKALLIAQLAGATALRARLGLGARRGSGAFAALARFFARDLDRRLGARRGLLEGDLEVVPKIRAALGTSAASPAAAEDVAEAEDVSKAREDVREVGEDCRVEPCAARGAADTLVAEAVVQ